MDAHIFIDNSNIYGGAQRAAATCEPSALWLAVRVYYKHLFRLIEGQDRVITRVLGGSIPPGNEPLWEHARQAGYNTDLLKRIETDTGNLIEQGVDELLHLKIANALLDYPCPQKLILCTGDGATSDYDTSFFKQVERAIRCGWNVELWSWKDQMSGRYARLVPATHGLLTIHELDHYYFQITFVKASTYFVGTSAVTVADRVVDKL